MSNKIQNYIFYLNLCRTYAVNVRSLITEVGNINVYCPSIFLMSQEQEIFYVMFLKDDLKVQFGVKELKVSVKLRSGDASYVATRNFTVIATVSTNYDYA